MLHRVRFVDDDDVRVEAVGRVVVGAERLELRCRSLAVQVLGEDDDPRAQPARLHEPLAVVEDDLRLLAFRRDDDALGAGLAVEERHIERDDRGDQRLAVLARDLVVDRPKAAQAGLDVDPREERSEMELLMRLQLDVLPGPLAFVVLQLLGEPEEPLGACGVEPIREAARAFAVAIAQMPRAREAVILAGQDATGDDALRVGVDRMGHWGPVGSPTSNSANGSPGRSSGEACTRVRLDGVRPSSGQSLLQLASARMAIDK